MCQMTYCNVSVNENSNITITSGCTNGPDGKIARENVQGLGSILWYIVDTAYFYFTT